MDRSCNLRINLIRWSHPHLHFAYCVIVGADSMLSISTAILISSFDIMPQNAIVNWMWSSLPPIRPLQTPRIDISIFEQWIQKYLRTDVMHNRETATFAYMVVMKYRWSVLMRWEWNRVSRVGATQSPIN